MSQRIPYDEPPRRRGRKPGGKNKPGHRAGRPPVNGNGQDKQYVAEQDGLPSGGNPSRHDTNSHRIPYDTPMPCTDGHGCPGNGNGRKPQICDNPLPNLPAKPLPPAPSQSIMNSVCRSGENPGLVTPEALIKEIQCLATSDIRLIPGCPGNIPDEIAPAISSFQITKTVHTNKDGSTVETESVKYTLWSKNTAQDQLARWHGLYAKDKTPMNVNAQFNQYNLEMGPALDLSGFTDAELETLEALLAKAGGGEILDLEVGPDGLGNQGL